MPRLLFPSNLSISPAFHAQFRGLVFLLPGSTYLNLFQLPKLFSSLLPWNLPQAFGHREGHYCQLGGGILLSAQALYSLIQNWHLCNGLLPNGQNEVFFPIPFAEFNQFIAGLTLKEAEQFLVQKSRGRFDPKNWEVAALFGADFAWARARHSVLHPSAPSSLLDLFLGQSRLHILRPIEPSLRIRPHPWVVANKKEEKNAKEEGGWGWGRGPSWPD